MSSHSTGPHRRRPSRGGARTAVLLGAVLLTAGAGIGISRSRQPSAAAPAPAPPFVDVAAEAGIRFRAGLPEGQLNIREIAGSGGGFLDFDRDGDQDVVLLGLDHCALYRNEGNGRFTEVTHTSGLPQKGQWIGCAAGDYDNDGYPDLFLSGYDCLALLHNERGKRFRDVTAGTGLSPVRGQDPLFATGAAWGDYDRDGWPDLYVCRYVRFRDGMQEFCPSRSGQGTVTCNPDHYAAQTGSLYRNLGGRRFQDVTRATGADRVHGKCWAAVFFDADGDGWSDLYLANDEVPGDLLRNRSGKRFENEGLAAGVAFDGDGRAHGAMGADPGDYDGDGHLDLAVTTFISEATSLYRNNGDGSFTDRAAIAGVGIPTQTTVGWGVRLFDYDRDGWLDLMVANGHASDSDRYPPNRDGLRQPMQLFRNGGGHFEPVPLGPAARPLIARGLASGDYDNDGDLDLLVADMGGEALLLRNDHRSPTPPHWLGIELAGSRSGREALGARVSVTAGGRTQVAEARTGGSLYSANDPRLLFGLGPAAQVVTLEVRWPSGKVTRQSGVAVDRYLRVEEPE